MKNLFLSIFFSAALFSIPATAQTPVTITDGLDKIATADGFQNADTTFWKRAGTAGLTISQASFSDWAAGGDPSIAYDALFNYAFAYKKGKHLWSNRVEFAYGQNYLSSVGEMRKTNDKIYLSSDFGYLIAPKLYAGFMGAFATQFAPGYDYKAPNPDGVTYKKISNLMAPGYLSLGVGFTHLTTPWLTTTFSPATWRGTFVLDDDLSALGAFGVSPGKHFRNEFGAKLKFEANKQLWPFLKLYSRLEFYSNYLHKPQNIDIRWDMQLNAVITKWVSANLTLNMLYDDDAVFADGRGARTQFKEVLGVGFLVSF